jgi:hypothetical protein
MNNHYEIINVLIENTANPNRQFCVKFSDAFLTHIEPIRKVDIDYGYVDISHNGKKVRAGIDKELQKVGNKNVIYYDEIDSNVQFDEYVENDVFLLHDETGLNYAHFFFDYFGRCLYFDKLIEKMPNLKLGVLEDFYENKNNSSFIKEWIDLYYEGKDVDIFIFKKDKRYKVKNLIVSNVFYWFPEGYGHDPIVKAIVETVSKVPKIETNSNGCYISRQDTIKRGWYHKRELKNELELIQKIKDELQYDIIELMDYSLKEKIQIFKSYKNIIQQSGAANINVLFSDKSVNNIIISHPVMEGWLNFKCGQFVNYSGTNLITLDGGGECIATLEETGQTNKDNIPWKIEDVDSVISVIKQIDSEKIWNS